MAFIAQSPDKNNASAKEASGKWSFMHDGLPLIRRAGIIFLTCFIIGVAMVGSSQLILQSQINTANQAQSQESKSQEKYRQAINERREIQDYQTKYGQLVTKGFVGMEKRLDLIETIESIQKNANLPAISYEIAEEQIFQVDPSIDMEKFELRGSKVVIKMNLLHEIDLMHFLDGLKTNHVYGLQNCNIKRLPENNSDRLAPRLHAECILYWITINKPDENEGENATSTDSAGL